MSRQPCLTCGQSIGGHARTGVIRQLAAMLVRTNHYPKVYSLLNQLPLCATCISRIPFLHDPWCMVCGRHMLVNSRGTQAICGDCSGFPEQLQITNRSTIRYDDWAKNLIGVYKYRGDERLMQLFSTLLLIAWYRHYDQQGIELITYVPLHDQRLRERGFNQTELLAEAVGRKLGLPVRKLLTRQKNTTKLSQQTGKQSRMVSMNDAFLPAHATGDPATYDEVPRISAAPGKATVPAIMLIDDIYTTGATIRSCAQTLRKIPALREARILSLTVCRS
ncbi:ComF family protein [Brevibacillus dissolubilis]|uniref:ComF family protein n=1 Tax=Brevibacillus dissolubilis TaxID=1844116 RepID=UPI0011162AE0|nr:double zinc ribbon domain-containing protein [Brevibacillus dissolubilis]